MPRDKYFSVEDEPALNAGSFSPDPSECAAAPRSSVVNEIETIRDSVLSEPHLAKQPHVALPRFQSWLQERRRRCTIWGNLGATALAALAGGPFALVGALMVGRDGLLAGLYVFLFGPVVEELLKQSGMVYLIEHKPYRIFAGWQFVAAAVVSAFLFASVENLMYIYLYLAGEEGLDLVALAHFRWVVCTSLHVCCSAIASLGLIRVWRRQIESGTPADLSHAFPMFVVAIAVHAIYNLSAIAIGDLFSAPS
jgi:hypothetical protein